MLSAVLRKAWAGSLALLIVPAAGLTTAAEATPATPTEAFQITYRAAGGELVSTVYTQAGAWATETVPLGLTVASDSSPGAATYNGEFHIVYRAAAGDLVNTWWTPGVGWKSLSVPVGPRAAGDISAVSYRGAFHIIYRSTAGDLINTRYTASGWEWQPVPLGERLAADASPDVTTWGDDLYISYRSAANNVINTRYSPTTGWSSQAVAVQAAPAGDVTNAGFGTAYHLAYRAAGTNQLRDVVYTAAAWSESSVNVGLNMATNASPDLAVYGDELHVVYRAAQGDLVNTWWNPQTGWASNSVPLGPTVAGDPSAVSYQQPEPAGLLTPPNLGGPNANGYYWLPDSQPGGLYTTDPDCRWGSFKLIQTIYTTAVAWNREVPGSPLRIGDLNGSDVHKSHDLGVDVDVSVGHLTVPQRARLAQLFVSTGTVTAIGYNGTGKEQVAAAVGGGIVRYWDGHATHFHVRIAPQYQGPPSRACS
jgi:hypothetical protein